MYIDDIEGIEPFLFTFFEYGSMPNEVFESWIKRNSVVLKFKIQDGDLIHKCGGRVKLWTMNKFFR